MRRVMSDLVASWRSLACEPNSLKRLLPPSPAAGTAQASVASRLVPPCQQSAVWNECWRFFFFLQATFSSKSVAPRTARQLRRQDRVVHPFTRGRAMPEPTKKEIEARAYQIWERLGRPEDKEAECWNLAEHELRNEDKDNPTRTPDTL